MAEKGMYKQKTLADKAKQKQLEKLGRASVADFVDEQKENHDQIIIRKARQLSQQPRMSILQRQKLKIQTDQENRPKKAEKPESPQKSENGGTDSEMHVPKVGGSKAY